jgi:hypothetical protein
MNFRPSAALALALSVGACATSAVYTPPPPPPPQAGPTGAAFEAGQFEWSRQQGPASIRGSIAYRGPNAPYGCKDSPVALTPDTPYSRERIARLYGATERAAVPLSVVRSRQQRAPSDAFSKFVRTTRCNIDNHFAFERLPAGSWFVIVAVRPQSGEGEPVAVLRRVQTGKSPQPRQVVMQ